MADWVKPLFTAALLLVTIPVAATERVSVGDREYWRCEFRANTFAHSAQSQAALGVGADGTITAVWSSRRQQGGRYGVYAQRFSPQGVAIGYETTVNLWTLSHQLGPDVAACPGGGAWIAWQSHGQDGHAGAIIARRFDAAFRGGSEVLVNEQWRGHQADPVVVVGAGGDALILWVSTEAPDKPSAVIGRRLDASGKPIGSEFAARKSKNNSVRTPAGAIMPDGSFVVAYSLFDEADRPAGIWMQRFSASGARLGDEMLVSGPLRNSQIEPVIAATRDGFVASWLDAESDGDDYGVMARRFDRNGRPLDEPFVVNTTRNGPQAAAAIAVARHGRFLIAWNGSDGDKSGVFGQLFAADGSRLGREFRINRHRDGKQALRGAASTGRIVFGPNDELVCVWNGDAGLGDKSGVNVTLLTPQPLELAGRLQGVTDEIRPATPIVASAGGPTPHQPPTFDPADVEKGERESRLGPRGGLGFTGIFNTGWTPPDPHMAVGPDHIVLMTNGAIAFFAKDGTMTFQDEIEDSFGFWGSVGASSFVFDPEVIYDELSGRFFAMAAEAWAPPGDRSYVLVAVSDDSDPDGSWHKYRFDTTSLAGAVFDSPNIGVDQQAVYITGDGLGISPNYPVYIFDKPSLLAGSPPAVTNSLTIATSTQSAGIPPVTDDTGLLYLIEHREGAAQTSVRLIALENGLGTPTVSTAWLPVPSYSWPEDPPQAGTSVRPLTFDARFWSAAYRNGSLWATHHVDFTRVRARWYEIAMNGWPVSGDSPALVQSGEIDPGGDVRTFFSAITVDGDGNAAMTFARSSPSEYISMASAYRLACDPLGTFRTDVIERSSSAPDTSERWGDYSAVEPDPVTARTFWAHHEYTIGSWRTWVASLSLPAVGDLNDDGAVDFGDLANLLANYGATSGVGPGDGDTDCDGDVDFGDLAALLANYGA